MPATEPPSFAIPVSRPRPSAGILVLLPVIATIALVCTFNTAAWIHRLYPGFFLWENNFVPAIGSTESTAVRGGLRYQSRLIAVDGVPVQSREQVEAMVTARPAGTEFRYTLTKGDAKYDVRLRSERLDLGTFALTLGNYLLNALIFLALGTAIIFLEPGNRGARAFFVFCANYGLYLALSSDLVGPSWFQTLYFFMVTLAPTTALQMTIDFPAAPMRVAPLRAALPVLYGISVALGTASVIAFHHSFAVLMRLDLITHLGLVAAFLTALVITARAFRNATSAARREQMKIFLLGLAGASLVPAIVLLAVYTAGVAVPLNYLTLGFAIFPAAIAYSITRHNLFGVDRIIRQTVAYVVVTLVIGLIYTGLLALLDYVLLPDLHASPAIHVLITMVLLAIFNPLRGRIQALVDLIYFRAPYDYRTTVTAASRALASILDLDELVARLVGIITEQMQVEHAEVWLRDGDQGSLRREGTPAATLAPDSLLVRYLDRPEGGAVHVAQRLATGWAPGDVRRELISIGVVLAVPIVLDRRLIGLLTLGEKRSGRLYSKEDAELLDTLANQAAVAIQNARAYRALAQANREVHAARDRLVETERLAAIGELSAAVAHGIRNPVAGIKSAAELAVQEVAADNPLRESFQDILAEADALEGRISELLNFARPFVPNYARANLNEIAAAALHLMRRQMLERRIEVSTAFAQDLPAHECDEAQMEQVCLALFSNAIEAMQEGGQLFVSTAIATAGAEDGNPDDGTFQTGWIASTGSRDGSAGPMLALSVQDTGPGMPPDQLSKIFRLFYTRKARGTGVGLATVKRLVDGHHGKIEVTSRVGQGTGFRVLLPAHPGAWSSVAAAGPGTRRENE